MSKFMKLVIVSLTCGALLTAVSYVWLTTPSGVSEQCAYVSEPTNPLSELATRENHQKQHGFPLPYYVDGVDENCMSVDGGVTDRDVSEQVKLFAGLIDVLFWAAVAALPGYFIIRRRRG